MSISAGELAARLQCELVRGDADRAIEGVANLSEAGPHQIAPYTDAAYLPQLKASRAGAVLFKRGTDIAEFPTGAALIASSDPEMDHLKIVRVFHPEFTRAPGIHATAIIEPGVELGADVHIGPYVCIESGSRIGARSVIQSHCAIGRDCVLGDECELFPRVTLYADTKLGRRVMLHSGVVLGADGFGYKFRGGKHVKVPHVGWVEIGDDVEIGANTCIDRGALGATRVGHGTKIDNLVQIGHNNDVGQHCMLCGQSALSGSCKLDDYVVLGGNVGLADHLHLGKGARVGAKSGVATDIPAGHEYWGPYAQEKKDIFRQYAALKRLPELTKRVAAIEKKLGEEK